LRGSITDDNIDGRELPGVTHLLRRDRDSHAVQVVMLKKILQLIQAGKVLFPVPVSARAEEHAEARAKRTSRGHKQMRDDL
jgi:hypothetical protein